MAAVTFSGTHQVVGMTPAGEKIVFSDITVKSTDVDIAPTVIPVLTKINQWAVGVKHPGSTPRSFLVTLGSDTSYLSGSNTFYIDPSGNATSGRLCIISVGA